MMAAGVNRRASRLDADSSRASSVPATTMTAPRSASLSRQRFRTRWTISMSSGRRSDWLNPSGMSASEYTRRALGTHRSQIFSLPAAVRLQKSFVPRQVVREGHFGGEHDQTRRQEIPPQPLPAVGLFG